jgi:hypothetical protein
MIKYLYYNYLGDNGTLLSPIHLPGVYCIKKYMISPDDDSKVLTKDGVNFTRVAIIPESEIDQWHEVDAIGQD